MDFGLEYSIFNLIGHSEDHGRLIKKIDKILNILPQNSKSGEGGVEPKSEWEQALLADFDFAELVDPSLDLELLELPDNFLSDGHNPLGSPCSLPHPSLHGVNDDGLDFSASSGSETETGDLCVDAVCEEKRPLDGDKTVGTPTKRLKRTRKMSLDLDWSYCPFDDNMSDIPPSLEKVCDRLSPTTFEDGGNSRDLQRKSVSSALDYLQRSGRKKRKVEAVKPEETSRKSSRQRVEKGSAASKPTQKAKSEAKNAKTKLESTSKASKRGESKSASPNAQQQHWDSLGDGVPHNVGAYRIGDSIQRHHMGDPMMPNSANFMQAYPMGMALGDGSGIFAPNGQPYVHRENCKMVGIYDPEARLARVARFHEKRRARVWRKKIKYDCRKKLADDRPRIKGRFVKCSVPEKPAAAPKPPKEATNLYATGTATGDFRMSASSSARPMSSIHMDYGMPNGRTCPSASSSYKFHPPTTTGKSSSLPYKYPYGGPTFDGSGTAGSGLGPDPVTSNTAQYGGSSYPPGYKPGRPTTFSQVQGTTKKTTAKSAYMKKKERDAAISKALGREHGSMVGTSVLNGTKNSSTFSSSKLNASIQSSKSVSGLKHSSYVSSKTMPGDIRTSAYKSKDGAKTSGYKIPPGYKAPTGGYKVPPGGYKAPPGYKVPTGSYKPPPGGHKAPPGYKVPTGSGYKSAISGTSTATTTTGLAEKGKPYAVSKPYATKAGSIGALNIGNNIGPKKFSAASSSTSTAKVASPSSSSMQNTCKDSVKAINKVSKTGVERSSGLSPNSTLSAPLDALGAGAAEVFTSK